ncbi:hypothetical protein A2U01_0055032 [Trifolium medium]|uniref:Uncharacterized protein n=1 Tax=Trifolium medium TaxID=97028 RepID=A0A392RCR1_9FABA|nr:hypothetical protein [Trifolium medium]
MPDDPPLRKEVEALRGQGHLREEMKGVRVRGETRVHLETPPAARKDTRETLRGDAPPGGTLHLLDTIADILQSRMNATRDLFRGESWTSHCPRDWRNLQQWISTTARLTLSTILKT